MNISTPNIIKDTCRWACVPRIMKGIWLVFGPVLHLYLTGTSGTFSWKLSFNYVKNDTPVILFTPDMVGQLIRHIMFRVLFLLNCMECMFWHKFNIKFLGWWKSFLNNQTGCKKSKVKFRDIVDQLIRYIMVRILFLLNCMHGLYVFWLIS